MKRKIHVNKLLRLILALSAFLLLLAAPIVSEAATGHWAAMGRGVYDDGSALIGYGVLGTSYMYPIQSPQDGDWVNSLYAGQSDGDFFEAGWYWRHSDGARVWFTVVRYGDSLTETTFNGGSYASGTWVPMHIRRKPDGTNNDEWEVWVNNVLRYTRYNTTTRSSYPLVGAERYDTNDYNKGSWTYIRYWHKLSDTSYAWRYWPNAVVWATPFQDPSYRFYNNRIDNANHWVYVDNHLN